MLHEFITKINIWFGMLKYITDKAFNVLCIFR